MLNELDIVHQIECIPINFATLLKFTKPFCPALNKSLEATLLNIYRLNEVYNCQRDCTIFEYHGEYETLPDILGPRKVAIGLYVMDNQIQEKKEYLIYDFNGVIGFVGGTLGLFVGFSIFNIVEHCLNVVKEIALKYTTWNWPDLDANNLGCHKKLLLKTATATEGANNCAFGFNQSIYGSSSKIELIEPLEKWQSVNWAQM